MNVKPHPIALDRVFFTRSVVIAVPEYQPTEGAISKSTPENSIDVSEIEGAPGRYQVVMRSVMNQHGLPSDPYIIDMESVALLIADQTLSKEDALRGITITGHSVLYGAIREAVAWITGRHPYGQLMLGLSVLPTAPPPDDAKEQ